MKVPFSYLSSQFSDPDRYWQAARKVVVSGDFTLGKELEIFENKFAEVVGTKYCIGVGSGTDAIFLSLKALGIGAGDEVITMANTFIATAGAIVQAGARPVFVEITDEYLIDIDKIEKAITPKTKAIIPVHYAGHPVDMPKVLEIAKKHNLKVVEDSCQAVGAAIDGKKAGSFGDTGAFSLHPLKNINVWSDGGLITTNSKEVRDQLILLRNHGMINRDEYGIFGYNSRLDTFQAAIGNVLIPELPMISSRRIENAGMYDAALSKIPQIRVPKRRANAKYVFHLYIVHAERRDELLAFLNKNEIEAKIHYPIPLHLQPCCKAIGYKKGDFPVAEEQVKNIITLPAHQHLEKAQVEFTISKIQEFYKK